MQAVPLAPSISELLKILPARGTRLYKKKINVTVILQKVIPWSIKLIWSTETSNVEQTVLKIGQIH